jgi:hypothetical protein
MIARSPESHFAAWRHALLLATVFAALLLASIPARALAAPPAPAFTLTAIPSPANFAAGTQVELIVSATNVGGGPTTSAPLELEVDLPSGLTATGASAQNSDRHSTEEAAKACSISVASVVCHASQSLAPGREFVASIGLAIPASASGSLLVEMQVSGGGAAAVSRTVTLPVQDEAAAFGYVAGLSAPALGADGAPTLLAGSHPAQQSIDFGFPVRRIRDETGTLLYASSGHPREIVVDMPRGMVADPSATPALCAEPELTSNSCPDASQVGQIDLGTLLGGNVSELASSVYNMVPPPGYPAELAFNGGNQGLFIHILGSVRSESDFGVRASIRDIPALGSNPVFNDYTQLWGNPSAQSHDEVRGTCLTNYGSVTPCPVAHEESSFLTMPVQCLGSPIETKVSADSWEEPGNFIHASYPDSDLQGNPVTLSGCNQLSFEPTISVAPTTDAADSPSGLEVDLHQPTDSSFAGRSPAIMKDAKVTLPEGLVANPSQADGLGVCSEQQIGYLQGDPEPGIHFADAPQSCPDAAKLGTVQVRSPLLAEYDAQHKRVDDPETHRPLLVPLKGTVYLAKPFANPFGSLLALYLAIEDPRTGIVAKLAGKVEPDPVTGRLTTTFSESPELPLEEVSLKLFGGARGALVTPPTCGTHTATATLTPWSAPETPDAQLQSSFQTSHSPAPGPCPASTGAAANAPAFSAGTQSPQAGAYSPFLLKLSREDGSQRLTAVDTTLPPGLLGRLAGVGECSDAQIAQAQARSHPEEGRSERESPSCPLESEVGVVNVGAGAGPNPVYVQGHAYLAGPYKGAPLSLAIITPAIAGPFDLGTVVTRVALHIEPETTQIHAVSDPLPQILDGVPLDIRSVALNMNRPQFTLNPTSCDTMAITGTATAASGQAAALSQRFQVGGCSALPFKPKLALSLKGATKRAKNPALKAVLTYPKGNYANIASAQVTLPHSEFLDQSHIKTVCTRVQFAARACPAASIYGKASATTPLLDQPLSGPVYLRSSSHPLPDLVADLNGQIEVTLDGKVDTGKGGGIRNTFQMVPDAPVSRFVLEMQGGKKGLLVNSENICSKPQRAIADFTGQNGKTADFNPLIKNSCKGGGDKKKGSGHKKGKGKQGPKAAKRPLDSALLGHPLGGW